MICVSITEATNEKALRAVERSVLAADAIELRMDLINDGDLPQLIAKARRGSDKVKIIVTCRRKEEALLPASPDMQARKKELTATAKMNLLRQAIALGADFIDIELACGEKAIRRLQSFARRQKSPTQVIVSWHDISKTPSLKALKEIFQACAKMEPDIVKIVTYARKASGQPQSPEPASLCERPESEDHCHVHGRRRKDQPDDGAADGQLSGICRPARRQAFRARSVDGASDAGVWPSVGR